MSQFSVASAAACGVALASFAVALVALAVARRLGCAERRRAEDRYAKLEAALASVRQEAEICAQQLRQLQEQPLPTAAMVPPPVQPGFNLSKRSQALRMSRRGEAPEQIARALGAPPQEVELLLKVHRIVLDSV